LFASALLGAMTSSDLPGNRAMFMMLGVLALFAMRPPTARFAHSDQIESLVDRATSPSRANERQFDATF
jgi:hypothetical protein